MIDITKLSFDKRKKLLKPIPHKQLVLLCCDWARLVLPIWDRQFVKDKRPLKAIEAAERFVNATAAYAAYAAATAAAATAAANAAYAAANAAAYAADAAYAAADAAVAAYAVSAVSAASAAAGAAGADAAAYAAAGADAAANAAAAVYKINLLHHLTKVTVPVINSDILWMSELIYKTRDTETQPILADELELTGCNDKLLLSSLREGSVGLSCGLFRQLKLYGE